MFNHYAAAAAGAAGQYKFNFALCRMTVAQWYYKYLIIVLIPLFVLSQSTPLCVSATSSITIQSDIILSLSPRYYLLWLVDNTDHGQSRNCFLCRHILKPTSATS